jgi:methionine biosynthesis protein MetW
MSSVTDDRAGRAHAYENPRPEVQELVPRDARRILDLGCSSGALGAALKERQKAEVVGVEVDPAYAADARERLDDVVEADLESFFGGDTAALGDFDCVIAADVLEHLTDPWTVLKTAVEGHLGPGGTAVISLPNIRYWHTFWMLGRRGTWPRTDVGICDRTHLRFFTLSDARELIAHAGLRETRVSPQYRARPLDLPREQPGILGLRPLSPFFAFQYVIAAEKPG